MATRKRNARDAATSEKTSAIRAFRSRSARTAFGFFATTAAIMAARFMMTGEDHQRRFTGISQSQNRARATCSGSTAEVRT